MDVGSLHIIDYIIFSILLCVSLGVGIYYAWKEKNQSADSFLLNWFVDIIINAPTSYVGHKILRNLNPLSNYVAYKLFRIKIFK